MDLEAKLDGLCEPIARIESKLDVICCKANGIPLLAARFEKKKAAEDMLLDDVRDLVRCSLYHFSPDSFKDGV